MKKNRLLTVGLIAALALSFTACSNPGSSSSSSDNGDSSSSSAPAEVTVSSVVLSQTSASMMLGGETLELTATVHYSDGSENSNVVWQSSDPAVASVENGTVTAVAAGNANIIATAQDDATVSATCSVTVSQEASLNLNASAFTMIMDKGTAKLTATVTHSDGKVDNEASWSSSASDVVSVSGDGTLTAVKAGTSTVTASVTEGGKEMKAECAVTVVANADELKDATADGIVYTIRNTDDNAKLGYSVKAENKDITALNIPDAYNGVQVTEIEEDGFRQCTKIESFSMGKSVRKIGAHAFTLETEYTGGDNLQEHNWKLEVSRRLRANLTLNPGTELAEYALADSFFRELTLPEGMTVIPAYAFTGATVTKVNFPASLTEIEGYAFAGCIYLESADLSGTQIAVIGSPSENDPFAVGNSFFQCGVLKTLGVMPSTLKTIEAYSFSGCTNLETIVLNSGLEKIGAQSFANCTSVLELTIPSSVTVIGGNAFTRWGNDQTIRVPKKESELPEGWSKNWAGEGCDAQITYTA